MHVWVCTHEYRAYGGRKRVSNPPELALQVCYPVCYPAQVADTELDEHWVLLTSEFRKGVKRTKHTFIRPFDRQTGAWWGVEQSRSGVKQESSVIGTHKQVRPRNQGALNSTHYQTMDFQIIGKSAISMFSLESTKAKHFHSQEINCFTLVSNSNQL